MWSVTKDDKVQRALDRLPPEIHLKFQKWKDTASELGPLGLRHVRGFRDHALKGQWQGARASRLNNKWRVIYYLRPEQMNFRVLEVTPHDYG